MRKKISYIESLIERIRDCQSNKRVVKIKASFEKHEKRAASYEASGLNPPESLDADMNILRALLVQGRTGAKDYSPRHGSDNFKSNLAEK